MVLSQLFYICTVYIWCSYDLKSNHCAELLVTLCNVPYVITDCSQLAMPIRIDLRQVLFHGLSSKFMHGHATFRMALRFCIINNKILLIKIISFQWKQMELQTFHLLFTKILKQVHQTVSSDKHIFLLQTVKHVIQTNRASLRIWHRASVFTLAENQPACVFLILQLSLHITLKQEKIFPRRKITHISLQVKHGGNM